MDQKDPEQRIADLERQLGEQRRGADPPPEQPAQQPNTAPERGSGSRTVAYLVLLLATLFGFVGVGNFGTGALLTFKDSVGTGTTATIDHCVPQTCYAKWSVGGASQTGPILGRDSSTFAYRPIHGDHLEGSQVDVRVRGGTAYERLASSAQELGRLFGGFVAIAAGVLLYWSARRKIRTGRWPWSRSVVL
jgi:hypothetical protein